jgi:hypothetical protein
MGTFGVDFGAARKLMFPCELWDSLADHVFLLPSVNGSLTHHIQRSGEDTEDAQRGIAANREKKGRSTNSHEVTPQMG